MSEFLPEDPAQLPPERWARMGLSVSEYHEVRAKKLAREARAPSVGDVAPDFEVERLSPDRGDVSIVGDPGQAGWTDLRVLYVTAISGKRRARERNLQGIQGSDGCLSDLHSRNSPY